MKHENKPARKPRFIFPLSSFRFECMSLFQPANALVIMTKAPQPGRSKTRLVPPLSYAEAADLARALLVDQLENLARFDGARFFIAFTPEKAAGFSNVSSPRALPASPNKASHWESA